MSRIITLRLRDSELAMLDQMLDSDTLGSLNRTEWIRRMIISEYQRRKGQGPARPGQYSSELRIGRPNGNSNS